jgi:hypothetical protein
MCEDTHAQDSRAPKKSLDGPIAKSAGVPQFFRTRRWKEEAPSSQNQCLVAVCNVRIRRPTGRERGVRLGEPCRRTLQRPRASALDSPPRVPRPRSEKPRTRQSRHLGHETEVRCGCLICEIQFMSILGVEKRDGAPNDGLVSRGATSGNPGANVLSSSTTVSYWVTAARIVRQPRGWSGTDKLG